MHSTMPRLRVRTGRAGRLAGACGLLMIAGGVSAMLAGRPASLQPGRDVLVRELAAGRVLVASRNLPDPNFAETVVLLVEYSRDGAAGLVLNRPSEVPLSRVLPGLQPAPAVATMAFLGGPVSQDSVLALSRVACEACPLVGRDVYLVNSPDVLKDRLANGADERQLRIYVGYAGWAGGQLDVETRQAAWHVLDGDARLVFDAAPGSLWQRAIRRAEAVFATRVPTILEASSHGIDDRCSFGEQRQRPAGRHCSDRAGLLQ